MAYRPIGRGFTGWGLIAKIDTSEAHAPVRQLQWLLSALGGAALVLGLGRIEFDRAAVRKPDSPTRQDVVGRRRRRSFGSEQGQSSDELGALSTAFNRHDRRARTLAFRPRAPDLGTDP